jgi:hypothetical protein
LRKRALILAIFLASWSLVGNMVSTWAGCKSDCKDQYESEVQSCNSTYDDPDDSDDLRMCTDDAKDAYDSCIEECES